MAETLTVVVPSLNEEGRIEGTVAEVEAVAPTLDLAVEILMINDGSSDRTGEIMRRLCAEHGHQMLENTRNLGVGASLQRAYAMLPEDRWITVLPGDNEIDFASIANFTAIRGDYDIILGYLQNPIIRPASRRLASWAFTRTVGSIYGFPYRYLNGMKLYRNRAVKGLAVTSAGHAFNAEMIAKAILRDPHLRVGEAPFAARGRATGNSKAMRPRSVVQAVYEVAAGWKSVAEFRSQTIRDKGE